MDGWTSVQTENEYSRAAREAKCRGRVSPNFYRSFLRAIPFENLRGGADWIALKALAPNISHSSKNPQN